MVEQNIWANDLVLGWREGLDASEPAMDAKIAHILKAEEIWMRRIHQRSWTREEALAPVPDHELRPLFERMASAYRELMEQDLSIEVPYLLMDGTPGRSSLEDIVIHVVTHGFHHRGQLAAMAVRMDSAFPNVAHVQYTRSLAATGS